MYHTVEELAGAEHQAGPRKLRVLEAHVGLVGITDKVATALAGDEEWTAKRKGCVLRRTGETS